MDWPCSHLVASPHQWTPLYCAALEGHVDTVQVLVEKGADINVKNNDGVCEWVCVTDRVLVLVIIVYDCVTDFQSFVSKVPC